MIYYTRKMSPVVAASCQASECFPYDWITLEHADGTERVFAYYKLSFKPERPGLVLALFSWICRRIADKI